MNREILLGDEAIGLGAIHAGLSGVYGYPGTPSTEIFEFIDKRTKKDGDVHAFWSTNEKVANRRFTKTITGVNSRSKHHTKQVVII